MSDIEIRPVTLDDQRACEELVRDAFWNVYAPGCHEHFLWHAAHAGHPDLVDGLSLVAVRDGRIVGCAMTTRATVVTPAGAQVTVAAPGPVAVDPAQQRGGIGDALMRASLDGARAAGFTAAFLYGDPHYYARFGFRDAAQFGVTTAEGDNFPAFMGAELAPGALAGVTGQLVESPLFEVDAAAVDAFDAGFPEREKQVTDTQL